MIRRTFEHKHVEGIVKINLKSIFNQSIIFFYQFLGSNQIRDDERIDLAQQCILNSNGSANAFVNEMISDRVLAGEDMPDELELKSKRFKNVVRNCLSEYMNQEMVRNNILCY